tara:strand:- start:1478 stop:1675 length:198 start_codon:yes stop_codon:yes gene_type:complete
VQQQFALDGTMLNAAEHGAAALLVAATLILSWFLMWRLVISQIPFVRALLDLPELSRSSSNTKAA